MREPVQENFAGLFEAIRRDELDTLRDLPWQSEPLQGEAATATFSNETGLTSLTGAIPFLEIPKREVEKSENQFHIKSENLAQFLVENRALFRSYQAVAQRAQQKLVGNLDHAHIAQVTSDIQGMEAANFAIYLACLTAESGQSTLLIDADPRNQFVFPLLTFAQPPKLLTENLQKPATFKADLKQCIVSLNKNLSYLNLQASSLRPFDDGEIARLCAFLDPDFENLVFYSGKLRSAWLSKNAHINYAVCSDSYKGEMAALVRHAAGCHTVLMKKGREPYLPCLSETFGQKRPLAEWQQATPTLAALRDFVLKTQRANRLVVGGREDLPGHLHCYTGFDLYAHYAGLDGSEAEAALNALQKRLRPYYPKSAFFSERSVMNRVKNLPQRTATTIIEAGEEPQLVSLLSSPELRAAAIFPAGILPAITANGMRISACSARGLVRFKTLATRGGFTDVLTAPRYRLQKPNALAAIMEQVQA